MKKLELDPLESFSERNRNFAGTVAILFMTVMITSFAFVPTSWLTPIGLAYLAISVFYLPDAAVYYIGSPEYTRSFYEISWLGFTKGKWYPMLIRFCILTFISGFATPLSPLAYIFTIAYAIGMFFSAGKVLKLI